MDHDSNSYVGERFTRIPTAVWLGAAALGAGILAIVVLRVPVSTVLTYGFVGFMLFSHLFMHGSHGGHAGHGSSDSNAGQADPHAGHNMAGNSLEAAPESAGAKTIAPDGTMRGIVPTENAQAAPQKETHKHGGCC